MEQEILKSLPDVNASVPLAELKTLLLKLRDIDETINKAQFRWGCMFGLSIPLLFYTFSLYIRDLTHSFSPTLAIGSAFATMIFAFLTWRSHTAINIDDSKLEVTLELLDILGKDLNAEKKIDFHLSGGDCMTGVNCVSSGAEGRYHQYLYQNTWFGFSAVLREGSQFSLQFFENINYRVRHHRKKGTKEKYGVQNGILLTFKPGKKSMEPLEDLGFLTGKTYFFRPQIAFTIKSAKIKKGQYHFKLSGDKLKTTDKSSCISKENVPIVKAIVRLLSDILSNSQKNSKFIKKRISSPC
ncbi:hypothetical protein ACFL35_04045 [Candidatus Riflebacteria bacterium]